MCFAAILYFCKRFKHIKDMKHLITLLVLGWALFYSPIHTRAEPYALAGVWTSHNQSSPTWGRSIKSPLIVDLVDHTLTLPSKVIGYTLTLESEDGEVYTYYIYGVTFEIPQELSGNLKVTISNENSCYQGDFEIVN